MLDGVLMPTPAAGWEGARLRADGVGDRKGIGPLLLVDVGGATTDVHSVCSGEPAQSDVIVQGLPEPYVKRKVEGDLGMRHNAAAIVENAGLKEIAADKRKSGVWGKRGSGRVNHGCGHVMKKQKHRHKLEH